MDHKARREEQRKRALSNRMAWSRKLWMESGFNDQLEITEEGARETLIMWRDGYIKIVERDRLAAIEAARNAPTALWERYGVPLPHVPTFEAERLGMEYVYVFSVEDSIERARLTNQSPRVKIGRTDGNPYKRIAEQVNSATPGAPIPVMIIRCASSRTLEKQLHERFKRSAVRGGGVEWFHATPREIVEAARALRPEMVQIQ